MSSEKPLLASKLVVSAFSCTAMPSAAPPPVLRNRFCTSSGFSDRALLSLVASTARFPPSCCVMPTSASRWKAPLLVDWLVIPQAQVLEVQGGDLGLQVRKAARIADDVVCFGQSSSATGLCRQNATRLIGIHPIASHQSVDLPAFRGIYHQDAINEVAQPVFNQQGHHENLVRPG